MLVSPSDSILVEITNKYEDEIHFKSGVKLYLDPSFNPNFHATSEGIVHSVPKVMRANKDIDPIVRPGDTVLFSYKTVGDTSFQGNTHLFRMTTKSEGFMTEWRNQDGFDLHMEKGPRGKWMAVYTGRKGAYIAGKVGMQGEVENWIAQNFKFAEGEGFTYDNKIDYNGKELWRVDYSMVFFVRRDGHMRAVGDYVLVEPIVEKRKALSLVMDIHRAPMDEFHVREDKGWCRCGGKGGFHDGDVILINPDLKEKYNIQGQPFYIVRRKYVLGKELTFSGIEPINSN
jgi:hypothetical protein